MSTESGASVPGIVKNGVVVPQSREPSAEGTHVEIIVEPVGIPQELCSTQPPFHRPFKLKSARQSA